jgi:hypothetical protein
VRLRIAYHRRQIGAGSLGNEIKSVRVNGVLLPISTERRETLIFRRVDQPGSAVYRLDIYMQGDWETVFLDI